MRQPLLQTVLALALTALACSPALSCKHSDGAGQPATTKAVSAARESGERPATKEACDACNGKWGRHGLAETDSCLCKTADGGKACMDGNDCQAHCMAGDADFVVVEKGPPPKGHYKGKCSEYDTVFGCHRFVGKGASKKGPQLAEDAADQLCYD